MHITDQYLALADQNRFAEALPLIEDIVRLSPNMVTSQFNYGICLAELGRHQDAARAFLRAYELDPYHGGALYRACLALAAADDAAGLLRVFRKEFAWNPEMIQEFMREEKFARFWEIPGFKSLRDEYAA